MRASVENRGPCAPIRPRGLLSCKPDSPGLSLHLAPTTTWCQHHTHLSTGQNSVRSPTFA